MSMEFLDHLHEQDVQVVKVEVHLYHVTCALQKSCSNASDVDWPGALTYFFL